MAGVVSLTDTEGVFAHRRDYRGLIRAREASFKRYQIDIAEFRERRFGAARRRRAPIPKTSSATCSW